jgi:predicted GNAT family acetyltransferase
MSFVLRRYATAEAFLAAALGVLEMHETANNLILGVPLNVRAHPERAEPGAWYVTVHNGDRLAGAALRTPPHHVVVHVEDAFAAEGDAIVALLLEDALAAAGDLNGVNGRVPWSEHVAQAWAPAAGGRARLGTRLRAFELRAVLPPPAAPGRLRAVHAADAALIIAWSHAFWDEVMGDDPGGPDDARIQQRLEGGDYFLWEDQGAPVCLVARSRIMPHGVTLGPIYTPPHARGRGFAANCTAAVSQLFLDAGWAYCALFTDLDNPVSNHVYEKIGYQPVCDYADYHFAAV